LETFITFVNQYQEHGARRENLIEFILSVDSKIKSIFYKAVAPSTRPIITLRVFKLAQSLIGLSPVCTQQVFTYLDKRFLGTVPEGTAEGAIEFIRVIVGNLRESKKHAQAFAKLQCQWTSCGKDTRTEVVTALAGILTSLEVSDGCWQDVPGLLKRLALAKPVPEEVALVIKKLRQREGIKGIEELAELIQTEEG
jgi:hypothetical protein